MTTTGDPWARYGRSLVRAMAEVLDEIPEEVRPHVLETADYGTRPERPIPWA